MTGIDRASCAATTTGSSSLAASFSAILVPSSTLTNPVIASSRSWSVRDRPPSFHKAMTSPAAAVRSPRMGAMATFFAGLSNVDAAKALGLAERTAKRTWAYARAWLHEELTKKS